MKDLQVVFSSDMELCFDGVNVKKYKAGEAYSPTHAHEKKMFEAFLADGRASVPKQTKSEPVVEQEKIVKPKAKKYKK
jgi:hypothetical protein